MQPNKHGLSYLSVSDHVLIQVAEGSWNLPTAEEYGRQIKQMVQDKLPPKWVLFIDLRKWQFCPPEVWDYFDELYLWLANNGMIGQVLLCDTTMMKHFVTGLDARAGNPLPFGQFICDNYDDALEWCQQQRPRCLEN
ncbi:hypothetical protein L4C34_11905 [Vibrio profundum]|uniref:hypothetical protein n=1 Tax=Vibrio profundum TaxID=2910247 RepID=UPI003D0EC04B